MNVTGVVLCGGRSERMGRDKALVVFEGEELFARAARLLGEMSDPVYLASGSRELSGWPMLRDDPPGVGPLGGIIAGLDASPNPQVAVVAADMPYVNPGLLSLLARVCTDEQAVVPCSERGPEPLHAVYARGAAEVLRKSIERGVVAVHKALDDLDTRYVDVDEWSAEGFDPRWSVNVNRQADLETLGITLPLEGDRGR